MTEKLFLRPYLHKRLLQKYCTDMFKLTPMSYPRLSAMISVLHSPSNQL